MVSWPFFRALFAGMWSVHVNPRHVSFIFFLVGPFIAPFVLPQNTRETAPWETAHHQLSDLNVFLLRAQVFFLYSYDDGK